MKERLCSSKFLQRYNLGSAMRPCHCSANEWTEKHSREERKFEKRGVMMISDEKDQSEYIKLGVEKYHLVFWPLAKINRGSIRNRRKKMFQRMFSFAME